MLSAHRLVPYVATLALQALKALYAHPLIFIVENLTPTSLQIEVEHPVRNLHARNLHAGDLYAKSINIPKYDWCVHNVHMHMCT